MISQTIPYDSIAPWDFPNGNGTGARKEPIQANWKERTTVDPLTTVTDLLTSNGTSWAVPHYAYESSDNSSVSTIPVYTSSNLKNVTLRRIGLRSAVEVEPATLITEDQITLIRSALSLRVTELAEVMNVQRPTIYGWLEGNFSPQPDKKARISVLFEIAKKWRSLNTAPLGKLLRESMFEGKSILDLLKDERLDKRKIIQCLEATNASAKKTSQPDRRMGLVADAMRRQGLDPDKALKNISEVTAISGRRFEDD